MSVIEALIEAASVRHRLPFKLSIAFLLNVLYTTLAHLKLYVFASFFTWFNGVIWLLLHSMGFIKGHDLCFVSPCGPLVILLLLYLLTYLHYIQSLFIQPLKSTFK